jgi:hypothetical protein
MICWLQTQDKSVPYNAHALQPIKSPLPAVSCPQCRQLQGHRKETKRWKVHVSLVHGDGMVLYGGFLLYSYNAVQQAMSFWPMETAVLGWHHFLLCPSCIQHLLAQHQKSNQSCLGWSVRSATFLTVLHEELCEY